MPSESQIPIASSHLSRRFAVRLALFYGAIFALSGSQLPFFPVWLRGVGIDAAWIGIISAVPAVTRFTILPLVTSFAERKAAVRGAMIITAVITTFGFAAIGTQHLPVAVFLAYVVTAAAWTPTVPLTDAYALRGVVRYGIDYGPVRLWGSAAFIVGALGCGWLADLIAAKHLIWIIAAAAALGAVISFGLQPLDSRKAPTPVQQGPVALLRDPGFLAIIAASALIQGSHSAYYVFGSITWQLAGLGGFTIAALWALGVVAEIVVFALSPRFTLQPSTLVVIGGIGRHGALADHGARAAGRRTCRRPACTRFEFRGDATWHHGIDGAACARSRHHARAGLSGRLRRDCRIERLDRLGPHLRPLRPGRLLPDGVDGAVGCDRDVVSAEIS